MKKIVYLLMAFTLVFTTACDPMEDVYDEIGDSENIITGDVTFEMSDDDYDFLEQGYGSFSSTDDAKELIPDLLDEKYPVWGVSIRNLPGLVNIIYPHFNSGNRIFHA